MTRTRYQINDIGEALPWASLYAFIKNLGTDSALARDLGKATGWETTLKTNSILADIYDMLQVIHADIISWSSRGKRKGKIKPYPRPGADADKKRKLGKNALPLPELRKWIESRRRTDG